jgi:hypothetical protein
MGLRHVGRDSPLWPTLSFENPTDQLGAGSRMVAAHEQCGDEPGIQRHPSPDNSEQYWHEHSPLPEKMTGGGK